MKSCNMDNENKPAQNETSNYKCGNILDVINFDIQKSKIPAREDVQESSRRRKTLNLLIVDKNVIPVTNLGNIITALAGIDQIARKQR